jgi:L-malate glycosyltransferase
MKKNILVTATTFPRWKNDTVPRFVYDLSERLTFEYNVTVLAPHHNGAKKKEKIGSLDVVRFSYFKPESMQKLCYGGGIIPNMKNSFLAKIQMLLLIISEFLASVNLIKNKKISLIHAHWMLPQGFVGVFLKKILKIPLLVTIHGSDLFPLKNVIFKNFQKFVVKNADYLSVNTDATRSELTKRFSDTPKIKIIPMGVDTKVFRKMNIAKPKKYAKNKILLFVGRLSDQKGLQYLIGSLPRVLKYDPSIKLLIIGEGPYKKDLDKKIDNLELRRYIEFLGSLSSSDVAKYYNYSDVFVIPSLATNTGTEALGLTLLEAMSSGCSVIGTNVGGIPSIIKNGSNGMLVKQKSSLDLSSAIISLLKDKKKAKKLAMKGSKYAKENYSWDKISKEFIQLYEVLLK